MRYPSEPLEEKGQEVRCCAAGGVREEEWVTASDVR